MDITKPFVHYVCFLGYIKNGGQIKLETPMKGNQKDFVPKPYIFKKCRRTMETVFSQPSDQFMLKRDYAKTIVGHGSRILNKITGLTLMQYIN
jgi:hypothetical protein